MYMQGANEKHASAPYDDDVQLLKILGIALKLCLLGTALVSPKKQRESCKSKRFGKAILV